MHRPDPNRPNGRAMIVGISIAVAYIFFALILEYAYYVKLSSFMNGVVGSISQEDPDRIEKIVAASTDAPKRGSIVRFLLLPFPSALELSTGGSRAAVYFGIVVQGIWLGLSAWGFCRARTNGQMIITVAVAVSAIPALLLPFGSSAVGPILTGLPILSVVLLISGFFRKYQ